MFGALYFSLIFYEKLQKILYFEFIFSITERNLKTPSISVPGFKRTISTLNGSSLWTSTNIVRWLLINLETVLWCKFVLLLISLIQSQPSSDCFKHLTIFITFFAVSVLILHNFFNQNVPLWRTFF